MCGVKKKKEKKKKASDIVSTIWTLFVQHQHLETRVQSCSGVSNDNVSAFERSIIENLSVPSQGQLTYMPARISLFGRGTVMMRNSSVKHCHPGSAYLEVESVGAWESLLWKQAIR